MSVVADALNFMAVLDNEIDVTKGGTDETRCITALNMATDYLESVAATMPKILSSRGVNTLKTAALVESTPLPPELLRIDKLWAVDPSTKQTIWPLDRVDEVGGHSPALPWPLNYVMTPANGQPRAYYLDSAAVYWLPIPDTVYEVRVYGLWSIQSYVDRESLVPLPDLCLLPLAAFACKYGNVGLDDSTDEIQKVAVETFTPVLRALRKRDRSKPKGKYYENFHTT